MPMNKDEERFAPAWLQSQLLSDDSQEIRLPSEPIVAQHTPLLPARSIVASLVLSCLLS